MTIDHERCRLLLKAQIDLIRSENLNKSAEDWKSGNEEGGVRLGTTLDGNPLLSKNNSWVINWTVRVGLWEVSVIIHCIWTRRITTDIWRVSPCDWCSRTRSRAVSNIEINAESSPESKEIFLVGSKEAHNDSLECSCFLNDVNWRLQSDYWVGLIYANSRSSAKLRQRVSLNESSLLLLHVLLALYMTKI